jgi:hypothetical protein
MEIISLNGIAQVLSSEKLQYAQKGSKSEMDFLETGFAGQTDFIIFRYSATSNGSRSDNRFRFQGNVGKFNRA